MSSGWVSAARALVASSLLACACREPAPRVPATQSLPPVQLDFIDDFNPPRPEAATSPAAPAAAWDAALGGLSGLHYVEGEQLLYAVSDDGRRYVPRLYAFAVELGSEQLRVLPRRVIPLREPSPSGLLQDIDAEALTGDGERLMLALEGHEERAAQLESRVLTLRADGLLTGSLQVPAEFLPAVAGQPPRGTRSNRGLEGLALAPGGRFLWAISESSLAQDGPEASCEHGTRVRLCRWDLSSSAPSNGGAPLTYFYPTEPIAPRPPAGAACEGGSGVSDLLALDERRLLVLERSYLVLKPDEQGRNVIRIFEIDVPQAAPSGEPVLLAKRLVLDLDDVLPRFDAGQQSLDNFEGMTLGPPLPSGARSLLLVADDNFNPSQRTVFLAFALRD